MKRILVVEDEASIRELVALNLKMTGWEVLEAPSAERALELIQKNPPCDVALLDIMLPGMDGFSLCETIRHGDPYIGIIMASAKGQESDKIRGLSIGADDYICKPYDIDILIAKINGIFKRKYALDEIVCDNLKLNNVTQTLTVNQTPVNVTEKEFQLLKLLVENKGTTLKKEYLFNRIWGSDSESELQTLTVHIKWLREKIEKDSKKPKHIITVWGTGYRYE